MKNLKPHFWYHKSQRNGVFLLLVLIVALQFVYVFMPFEQQLQDMGSSEVLAFQKQLDSLKIIELEKRKPKLYSFNPNYITDFKGYQLGMSVEEIDRLYAYRKQHKFINSVQDFKKVTNVSDSLLRRIAPYFKFPTWKVKDTQKPDKESVIGLVKKLSSNSVSTHNINLATANDFGSIYGIGEKLSERIIKYRSKLQGFSFPSQLYEVWGLDKTIANKVLAVFKITDTPKIKKININTASFKEVLKNPYINYELCKKIFDYKDEVAELQSLSELKRIENFPLEKYDRIILYLLAK